MPGTGLVLSRVPGGGVERACMRGAPRCGQRRSPGGAREPFWRVSDELCERLAPLLQDPPRRFRHPGRPRYAPRVCLEGVLFLLYTGTRYVDLPRQLGFPSGETCRRRLHDWIRDGVWDEALELLIAELDQAGVIDWSRVLVDASIVDAKRGATRSARAPSTARNPRPSTTLRSTRTAGRSRDRSDPETRTNARTWSP